MRIVLCHQPTDGGVGRHVSDVLAGLSDAGHETVLCSPAVPAGPGRPSEHVALDMRRAIAPRQDAAAIARLAAVVRRVRPDVVHAHSSKAGAVARAARLATPSIPVLYTPHGYAFAGHFSREAERRAYRAVERSLAPLASRVVCVCEAEALLARSVGSGARVRVVHNGIEPPGVVEPDPAIAALAGRGPVIGALTLLRPGKGLETLIDAIPQVLARHPEARLAIVGDGEDEAALRARCSSLGVEQAVAFLGASTNPLGMLAGMDVFVHPSWAESFPYVILEAMSVARPIVASDVGGIGEALRDGESGRLVPARDPAALAAALVRTLDDPEEARRLGRHALERVQVEFTRTAMTAGLVDVYAEVARGRATR